MKVLPRICCSIAMYTKHTFGLNFAKVLDTSNFVSINITRGHL